MGTKQKNWLYSFLGAAVASVMLAQTPFLKGGGVRRLDPLGGNEGGSSLVQLEGGGILDEDNVRTAREVDSHSTGTPSWSNPVGFEKDVFTFARVIFRTGVSLANGSGYGRRLGWWVDFPDADLNLSYRFQQLTSTRVDPDGRSLKLTDPDLLNFPLLYMTHPGYIIMDEAEVLALRNYFAVGGALLVIDFWSTIEWEGFAAQMKRVLPDRRWVDLGVDHPVFNSVFDIKGPMQRLQVPTMQFWNQQFDPRDPNSRISTAYRGDGYEEMHVRALFDDKNRMIALAIHNSDISDGWEREGENDAYFRTFAEKICYPLGINMIFYLMTH